MHALAVKSSQLRQFTNEFPLFPKLPAKSRLKIWQLAFPNSRHFSIDYGYTCQGSGLTMMHRIQSWWIVAWISTTKQNLPNPSSSTVRAVMRLVGIDTCSLPKTLAIRLCVPKHLLYDVHSAWIQLSIQYTLEVRKWDSSMRNLRSGFSFCCLVLRIFSVKPTDESARNRLPLFALGSWSLHFSGILW